MIRKQMYIEKRQERLLKQLAKKTGMAESEIMRQALDLHMNNLRFNEGRSDLWKEEMEFVKKRLKKGFVLGGRQWRREDLHER